MSRLDALPVDFSDLLVALADEEALASLATLAVFHPQPLGVMLGLAAVAGFVGALAELFSTKLDDNFTIPVAVATVVMGGAPLLGA